MDYTEKKLRRLNTYEGIIINVGLDRVSLPDGSEAFREIVEHPGGACILPVDGEGNAYCVRQYRYPIGEHLLEAPAGKLERGEDPAAAARSYGKLQAWLYPVLGVLDRFLWLQFDELRILPDFGSGQPTVEDRVSCRVSAQALFIVLAAVRVLYEFWRKKVLDIFL